MPNGVSCLFFAGKNLIYGKKENNVFKTGIGAIQTVRGADFLTATQIPNAALPAQAGTRTLPGFLRSAANTLKKFLYPLIIASGIYNTVKADDKVKTGASQAGGIGLMFCFEELTDKALAGIEKTVLPRLKMAQSKPAKVCWYLLSGLAFAGASMLGYTVGNKIANKAVNGFRNITNSPYKQIELHNKLKEIFKTGVDTHLEDYTAKVFEDIESEF